MKQNVKQQRKISRQTRRSIKTWNEEHAANLKYGRKEKSSTAYHVPQKKLLEINQINRI